MPLKCHFLLAFVLALGCGARTLAQAEIPPRDYWPTADWKTRSPEELGIDGGKLRAMDAFVKGALPATSSILVVRHRYIAWESYYAGDRRSLRPCYSMTKSVVSILVGMMMKNHQIKDMEDPMLSYLPDLGSGILAPGVDKIAIRHLLTMTSGFPDDGGVGTVFVKGYLAKPLKTPPGETSLTTAQTRISYR
jgi:CubicO group peptidase (beta-lactamase class C family)